MEFNSTLEIVVVFYSKNSQQVTWICFICVNSENYVSFAVFFGA